MLTQKASLLFAAAMSALAFAGFTIYTGHPHIVISQSGRIQQRLQFMNSQFPDPPFMEDPRAPEVPVSANHSPCTQLGVEYLEPRELPSIAGVFLVGKILDVYADNSATKAVANRSAGNVVIVDGVTGRSWTFGAAQVKELDFIGGSGNDRFRSNVPNLSLRAFGGDGDDTLIGNNSFDSLQGGRGNDTLIGSDNNDVLVGGPGDDRLYPGAGIDTVRDGLGNDLVIAIDDGYADTIQGGPGRDVIWVDTESGSPTSRHDLLTNLDDNLDSVQYVQSFANGADRTLDGDRIADPAIASPLLYSYRTFTNKLLFSRSGPRYSDSAQGSDLGDCWLLAGLGAIAQSNPDIIRQRVVDFGDGTYGVRLGGQFYRVDSDLPARSNGSLAYAGFGDQGSMWIPIVEKAFAQYRVANGFNNAYWALNGGLSDELFRAFGAGYSSANAIGNYNSPDELRDNIVGFLADGCAVTIGTNETLADGTPLVPTHAYAVIGSSTVNGLTYFALWNPWGFDGAGDDGEDDGVVTISMNALYLDGGNSFEVGSLFTA